MVEFELVPGKKGVGDVLVKVYASGEVLTFSEVLFILGHYFRSERDYYPPEKGFLGDLMLFNAVRDIQRGKSLDDVCQNYKLRNTVHVR